MIALTVFGESDNAGSVLALLVILFLYFLPAVVATMRGHHNAAAITVLNIFLGCTFIGWVIALVWAFTAVQKPVDRRRFY